jgi:pimeloyl-ACP methyl ester carboxylesterase
MRRLTNRAVVLVLVAWSCGAAGCALIRGRSSAATGPPIDATALSSADSVPSLGFDEPTDQAGQPGTAQLYFLDPYQPGRIPVVLIHGLFSTPEGWNDLIQYLRAEPSFCERFQIWAFGYPTGQGFLQSAATLRAKLRVAVDTLDPQQADPALRRMVLIGHSMGGLIAKLQVTYSEEVVWARVANRPLAEIVTTESTRDFLAKTCYFEPSPHVSRVIFIASPHCGSLCSSAMVGRCTALFIQPTAAQAELHQQLMRDNPHTFNPVLEQRFPTSIDMLVPSSPLLDAMREMRLREGVALHTILGVSHPVSLDGPSDGVVSVYSAMHPGCDSVLAVATSHAKVHHSVRTALEVLRILQCDVAPSAAFTSPATLTGIGSLLIAEQAR